MYPTGKNISIHTPARGVTQPNKIKRQAERISIHTPARGVTSAPIYGHRPVYISIHTPARGVTAASVAIGDAAFISIHTPARGVTLQKDISSFKNRNFNPHSRTGSDFFCNAELCMFHVFQSTLPHGE